MKSFVLPHLPDANQKRIDELRAKSPRFAKVFREYTLFSTELWNLETADGEEQIPDDFIDALHVQISALEDEISDWMRIPDAPND